MLNDDTYQKIKVLSNKHRFEIFKLVSKKELNIKEISLITKLSYDKTREYINKLVDVGLVEKNSIGRETFIKSKSSIYFQNN